eukprot:g9981.t1 g9981   contig4:995530-997742(+)
MSSFDENNSSSGSTHPDDGHADGNPRDASKDDRRTGAALHNDTFPALTTRDMNGNRDRMKRYKFKSSSFDTMAFHRLQQERLVKQQEISKQKLIRNKHRSRLPLITNPISPKQIIMSPVSMKPPRSAIAFTSPPVERGVSAQSAPLSKINAPAKQELLRLSQRYSSSIGSQRHVAICDDSSDIFDDAYESENEIMSSSAVVTPDVRTNKSTIQTIDTSNGCNEDHMSKALGRHYLLHLGHVARSHYPLNSSIASIDKDEENADDGEEDSCSSSHNTPTPHLRAASACDSHGDHDDDIDYNEQHHHDRGHSVDRETNYFSCLCKAHLMLSGQHTANHDESSVHTPTNSTTTKALFFTKKKKKYLRCFARCAVGALLAVALCTVASVAWRKVILLWQLCLPRLSSTLLLPTRHLHRIIMKTASSFRASATAQNEVRLEMHKMTKQQMLAIWRVLVKLANRVIILAKRVRHAPGVWYANATKDIHVPSLIIESMYRIARGIDLLATAVLDEKSDVAMRRSTLTIPINSLSDPFHTSVARFVANNQTQTERWEAFHKASSPRFWKASERTTFVGATLPLLSDDSRRYIHSLPSLEQMELPLVEAALHTQPSSRPALELDPSIIRDALRMKSTIASAAVHENLEKMMMQYKVSKRSVPKAISPEMKNYYTASYPVEDVSSEGNDVFDAINLMDMAFDLLSNKRVKRRKD